LPGFRNMLRKSGKPDLRWDGLRERCSGQNGFQVACGVNFT
jgi:hypothetical protein